MLVTRNTVINIYVRASIMQQNLIWIVTLETITVLSLLPDNVQHGVDQLGPLGVVPLRPVVPGAVLTKNKVIRSKDLAHWSCLESIHGTRLQIHEHCSGYIAAPACLVVVYIHPLQFGGAFAYVITPGIDAVLLTHYFPELSSDLVAALPGLYVQDLSHFLLFSFCFGGLERS